MLWIFFASSYAPLFVIVAIREIRGSPDVALALVVVAGASAVALFALLEYSRRAIGATEFAVTGVSAHESDAVGYIVTYLIPFLDLGLNDPIRAISLIFLLLVVGALYVNSKMFYVNPLLSLVGFHLFEIVLAGGDTYVMLARRRRVRPGQLMARRLDEYVVIEAGQ